MNILYNHSKLVCFVNTKNVIKQIYIGRFEFVECDGDAERSADNPYGLCIAKCGQSCSDKRRTCNSGWEDPVRVDILWWSSSDESNDSA